MAKHWTVEVMGERVLALGDDELHAKRFAVRKYFDLHPEKIGQVVELTNPCQWGEECPDVENCSACSRMFADE